MRYLVLSIAALAALAACGQSAPSEAAQGGAETRDAYVARCTRELIAQNPQAQSWAGQQCEQQWANVEASEPLAEAMLAAVPASGETVAPSAIAARTTMIRWRPRAEGTLIAQGDIGGVEAQVDANGLTLLWSAVGEPIPLDLPEAFRVLGAEVTMIGCAQVGVGESTRSYRIAAPGREPFALGVYQREAPTANASSFYNATANVSGAMPTLAQLARDGNSWEAQCPY